MTARLDGVRGVSTMIPGVFEPRPFDPLIEPHVPQGPCGPHVDPAAPDDLERLEREREGGGAPANVRRGQRTTVSDKIQHSMMRLTERLIGLMAT